MPNYPFVVLPHPITSMTKLEIASLAEAITDRVEQQLTQNYVLTRSDVLVRSVQQTIQELNCELQEPLRADGADLLITQSGETELQFELVLEGASCSDCIMPTKFLHDLFEKRTKQALNEAWTIRLIDPRR